MHELRLPAVAGLVFLLLVPAGHAIGPRTSSRAVVAPSPSKTVDPRASLQGLACAPSASWCAAVGSFVSRSMTAKLAIYTFARGNWTVASLPFPAGAGQVNLLRISAMTCPTRGQCVAVGTYRDARAYDQGLIVTDSGGAWKAARSPVRNTIRRVSSDTLSAVSCPASGACVAVGAYHRAGRFDSFPEILTERGSKWTAARPPSLPGQNGKDWAGNLSAVACEGVGSCVAAGTTPVGTHGAVVSSSNGVWISRPAQLPAGTKGRITLIGGVGCPANGACTVVADFGHGSFDSHGVLITSKGGDWLSRRPSLGSTIPKSTWNQLRAVSCTPAGRCFVGGWYGPEPKPPPSYGLPAPSRSPHGGFVLTSSGTGWKFSAAPMRNEVTQAPALLACTQTECAGEWGNLLVMNGKSRPVESVAGHADPFAQVNALACTSSRCFGAGDQGVALTGQTAATAGARLFPLLVSSTRGDWSLTTVPLPASAGVPLPVNLRNLACASGYCLADGAMSGAGNHTWLGAPPVVNIYSGGRWSARWGSVHGFRSVQLSAIQCPAPSQCVATGTYRGRHGRSGMILTQRKGQWKGIKMPLPVSATGGQVGIDSLSCDVHGQCAATGSYRGGRTMDGLLLWNRRGRWTAAQARRPAVSPLWGSDVRETHVSCGRDFHCVAIGGGGSQSLLSSLGERGWQTIPVPLAASRKYRNLSGLRLLSVSCPISGDCGVLGSFYTGTGQQQKHVLLMRGYGTDWHMTIVTPPRKPGGGRDEVSPSAESCPTASRCFVLGTTSARGHFLAYEYAGSRWTEHRLGLPAGGVNNAGYFLNGLSCLSAGSCLAVGTYARRGARNSDYDRPLLIRFKQGRWTETEGQLPLTGIEEATLTGVTSAGSSYMALGWMAGGDFGFDTYLTRVPG